MPQAFQYEVIKNAYEKVRCNTVFSLKICYHNETWQHSASPWVSSCLLRVAKVVTPKFIRSIEYLEVSYSIYTIYTVIQF